MAVEAQSVRPTGEVFATATAAVVSGEVRQLACGLAGVRTGLAAAASGDRVGFATSGVFRFTKSGSVVILPGQELWWDPTNNIATYAIAAQANAGFFLGLCVEEDAVAAATTDVMVDLNRRNQSYLIDQMRSGFVHANTAAAGAVVNRYVGGEVELQLVNTNEAECVDMLSSDSIAVAGDAIFEAEVNIVAAAGSATDLSVGLANATSTTDADAITESVFIHVDGGSQNILAESDDGTTEVAATDTTLDWTASTRFFVQMDLRNQADIQIYVNGALVLGSTLFVLTAATGPLKALIHLEKSASTNTAHVRVRNVRAYRCLAA